MGRGQGPDIGVGRVLAIQEEAFGHCFHAARRIGSLFRHQAFETDLGDLFGLGSGRQLYGGADKSIGAFGRIALPGSERQSRPLVSGALSEILQPGCEPGSGARRRNFAVLRDEDRLPTGEGSAPARKIDGKRRNQQPRDDNKLLGKRFDHERTFTYSQRLV